MSRITTETVTLVKELVSSGKLYREVAVETGWSIPTICRIVSGKRTAAPPRPRRRCGLRGCRNVPSRADSEFCCVGHYHLQKAIEKRRRK